MIPIHNPAGGTRAAANLSRDVATGPCSTGRENNRSDGFVSPLFRKTQTGFVLLHSLCLKSLALVLRTGVVRISSSICSQCLISLENHLSVSGLIETVNQGVWLSPSYWAKHRHLPAQKTALYFLVSTESGRLRNATLLKPGSLGFLLIQ